MRALVATGIVWLLTLPVLAADDFKPLNVKPGLWEAKSTTSTAGMPGLPDDVVAKMTPEQRARVEAAMKAQQQKGPMTNTQKSCITQEMLNKPMNFGQSMSGECKYNVQHSSSSEQDISFQCGRGKTTSSGTLRITVLDSENVKGDTDMSMSMDGTHKMSAKSSFSAHRVSGDCGNVKPETGH